MSEKLHKALVFAIHDLREKLGDANVGSMFRLDIEVSGRVSGGDVNVKYILGESYGPSNASASRLNPVCAEYIRRKRWNDKEEHALLESPDAYRDNEPE